MDLKTLETELDKAFIARDIGEINRLNAAIEATKKDIAAKKEWLDHNKAKIAEVAKAIKEGTTLEEVLAALDAGIRAFPRPGAPKAAKGSKPAKAGGSKGVYKWDPSISKNRLVDGSGNFVEPPVLMRGRYAAVQR